MAPGRSVDCHGTVTGKQTKLNFPSQGHRFLRNWPKTKFYSYTTSTKAFHFVTPSSWSRSTFALSTSAACSMVWSIMTNGSDSFGGKSFVFFAESSFWFLVFWSCHGDPWPVPSSWKKMMMMMTISLSLRNERAYDVSIPLWLVPPCIIWRSIPFLSPPPSLSSLARLSVTFAVCDAILFSI